MRFLKKDTPFNIRTSQILYIHAAIILPALTPFVKIAAEYFTTYHTIGIGLISLTSLFFVYLIEKHPKDILLYSLMDILVKIYLIHDYTYAGKYLSIAGYIYITVVALNFFPLLLAVKKKEFEKIGAEVSPSIFASLKRSDPKKNLVLASVAGTIGFIMFYQYFVIPAEWGNDGALTRNCYHYYDLEAAQYYKKKESSANWKKKREHYQSKIKNLIESMSDEELKVISDKIKSYYANTINTDEEFPYKKRYQEVQSGKRFSIGTHDEIEMRYGMMTNFSLSCWLKAVSYFDENRSKQLLSELFIVDPDTKKSLAPISDEVEIQILVNGFTTQRFVSLFNQYVFSEKYESFKLLLYLSLLDGGKYLDYNVILKLLHKSGINTFVYLLRALVNEDFASNAKLLEYATKTNDSFSFRIIEIIQNRLVPSVQKYSNFSEKIKLAYAVSIMNQKSNSGFEYLVRVFSETNENLKMNQTFINAYSTEFTQWIGSNLDRNLNIRQLSKLVKSASKNKTLLELLYQSGIMERIAKKYQYRFKKDTFVLFKEIQKHELFKALPKRSNLKLSVLFFQEKWDAGERD